MENKLKWRLFNKFVGLLRFLARVNFITYKTAFCVIANCMITLSSSNKELDRTQKFIEGVVGVGKTRSN